MCPIKFSVIVPVYNAKKYLRECLDSIVNQTLKEIFTEIIADKVRKKFKKDMEFLKEKEYNLDLLLKSLIKNYFQLQ